MPGGKNDLSKTILRGIAKYQRWSALTIKKNGMLIIMPSGLNMREN